MKTITWNRERFAQLKAGFERALQADKRGTDTFRVELEGYSGEQEFVVSYARHLIDYLNREFAANPDQPRRENREGEEGQ